MRYLGFRPEDAVMVDLWGFDEEQGPLPRLTRLTARGKAGTTKSCDSAAIRRIKRLHDGPNSKGVAI